MIGLKDMQDFQRNITLSDVAIILQWILNMTLEFIAD